MSDDMVYPPTGVRVVAIREGGARIIARRGYSQDTFFRSPKVLHWLDNDNKFISVGVDRVIAWEPLVDGKDGNPNRCELCDRLIPERRYTVCDECRRLRDRLMPLMRNEHARAYILAQCLDVDGADSILDMHALTDVFGCGPRTAPRREAWGKLVDIARNLTGRTT